MEKTYTISQISKLLGLTNDAIRFYEKKGLVHPTINPHNSYRMYTLKNVLELLDIIYYRHLDFSIIEIQELYQNLDPTQAYQLVETQKIKVERRILYEQQLLKKINYIQSLYHQIKTDKNIEITTFQHHISYLKAKIVTNSSLTKLDILLLMNLFYVLFLKNTIIL
ncbi:MAG: MerR family transcriptional regulator [Thomasclavelia sp.]